MPGPIDGYNLKFYSNENGLPQNSVKSIVKDDRGNIWLATERGIVRYDGFNFKVFDQFGSSNRFKSIGAFLLSPRNVGPHEFYAVNNEYTYIRISQGTASVDSTTYPKLIQVQPFGKFGSDEDFFISSGIPNVNERHLKAAKLVIPLGSDRFYVYDKSKLYFYEQKKLRRTFELTGKAFSELFRIGKKIYHVQNAKITGFDGTNDTSVPRDVKITGDVLKNPLYAQQAGISVYWNNCNDQAFITVNTSLYLLTETPAGDLQTSLICQGFDYDRGIISNVFWDPATKRLFLGSHFFGLYVLEPKPFRSLTAVFPKTDNVYYGQVAYGNNGLLSNQGHLFTFEGDNGRISVEHLKKVSDLVEWDKIGILIDRKNQIWCKKARNLFVLSSDAKRLVFKWELPSEITQLYQDVNGLVWIGTGDEGLYRINPSDQHPQVKTVLKTGISNISWIHSQSGSILWIGTASGLKKVDLSTKQITNIKGLDRLYIRSLYQHNGSDQLWITTYNDGFFLLQSGKLTAFPFDEKRYLASAHCIFEDLRGYFWITTNNGLFQVRKSDLLAYADKPFDLYYHYYNKQAGFNTNEFNGGCLPCAVRTRNGLVSFPSINGLVTFSPETIRPELPSGSINFEALLIDEKAQAFDNKSITISPQTNQVALLLNVAYLGNQNNLKISFRLYSALVLRATQRPRPARPTFGRLQQG